MQNQSHLYRTDIANKAWHLTVSGRCQEALPLYNEALALLPSAGEYNNRGIAKLLLNEYQAAADDFQLAQKTMPIAQNPYIGGAYWLMGLHIKACEQWSLQSKNLKNRIISHPIDSALGMTIDCLLLWASRRIQKNDWIREAETAILQKIKKLERRGDPWPTDIGKFLIYNGNRDLMERKFSEELPYKSRCQLSFYLMNDAFDRGDLIVFEKHRHVCLSLRNYCLTAIEWHIASQIQTEESADLKLNNSIL